MARKKTYDLFISYRRKGGQDFARSLACQLRLEGYQCFFDQHELKTGEFNQQIYEAIENSKYFVIILTPEALDRCAEPDDWVRKEIEHARKVDVPVVPVAILGESMEYPESLPESLAWLKKRQASYIDKGSTFEITLDAMVKDQMPALLGMTKRQHRKVAQRAENVCLRKAARFLENDGAIGEAERRELERLATASGISPTRLEELVEQVEAAAIRSVKRKAWMKAHIWTVLLFGLALFVLLAWWIARTWLTVFPQENSGGATAEEHAEAIPPPGELAVPPKENPENTNPPEAGEFTPSPKTTAEPKKTTERVKTVGNENTQAKKTGKTASAGRTPAEQLAALNSKMREYAEADFRNSLKKPAKLPPTVKLDTIDYQIVKEYEKIAAEGRKLHKLGMHPKELMKSRPDLVLKFAEFRNNVKKELRQLIKDNKQEEALRYYNSATRTFDMLGLCPLSRPSFSN